MHKWAMFGVFCVASLLGLYLILFTLPSKEEVQREAAFVLPDQVIDAQAAETLLVEQSCISCHGDQLEGGMGPALANIGATKTKEQIYRTILNGRNQMPAYEDVLTEEEIINISLWLAEKK